MNLWPLKGRLVYAKDSEMAVKILLSRWLVNELHEREERRLRFINAIFATETRARGERLH